MEEKIVSEYRLFVDTCSLMHEKARDFFYRLALILIAHKKQVIIPYRVAIEIDHLQSSPKPQTSDAARIGVTILKYYNDHGISDIRGEKNDPFADNVFHYVFSKFRTQYDLALLTQDKGLAMDILALKRSQAIQSSKNLLVLKLDNDGNLLEWKEDREWQKFRLCAEPRPPNDRILGLHQITDIGDHVDVGDIGRVRLTRVLGEGGEGRTFLTDSNHACKVYFKERLTESRFEKLSLMADRKIDIPGVCWPLSLARNSYKEFVGYLMPVAEGTPMFKCMFVKPLLEKNFPHWSRRNLVQLSISWLEKVVALHSLNILIGDVNPLNFLIKSDQELYFVDVDSYQIEDFPCPVGMSNFTAPEIQGNDFASFLRKFEHEYFAIATLLFMILLPGKPPYSHQGGGNPVENIKKGQFSYPLGKRSDKKTPDGPWRFIWSHLPYRTKEAFYNCFVNHKRIRPDQWLDLMRGYKHDLERGYLDPGPDRESDRLFPSRLKGVTPHAKGRYDAKPWQNLTCNICGKNFDDPAHKMKNSPRKLCPDCRQTERTKKTKGEMIICSDCGEEFLFSDSERESFERKGFDPPKRCKKCRDVRSIYKYVR